VADRFAVNLGGANKNWSDTTAVTGTWVKTGGSIVNLDYLVLTNFTGSPTNYIAWFAGAHSTDSGGNTGITFASMESLLANTICPTFMTPTYPTRKTESVI